MKRNAIIRIVLYTLALLVLLGILAVGLGANLFMVDHVSSGTSKYSIPLVSEEETVSTVVEADQVQELDIDWAAGSVSIIIDEYATDITVIEPKMTQEKHQMRCNLKDGKLGIDFREETVGISGIEISKELIIVVPADWQCEELSIDTAAASIEAQNLKAVNVDVDAASGVCNFKDCRVSKLDIDTASGDVYFSGSLNELDFDAMSANCHLVFEEYCPHSINIDSMSGDLLLELPEDIGFVLRSDSLTTNFNTDYETTRDGNKIISEGTRSNCMIHLSALSGDVTIRKYIAK
jgi:DUF4097 and DUF4098 domain-containing protein YvlB